MSENDHCTGGTERRESGLKWCNGRQDQYRDQIDSQHHYTEGGFEIVLCRPNGRVNVSGECKDHTESFNQFDKCLLKSEGRSVETGTERPGVER